MMDKSRFKSYEYQWKGKTKYIGPKERDIYSDEEWLAAMHAIVSTKEPDLYIQVQNNDVMVLWVGYAIYLEERYKYLLFLLDSDDELDSPGNVAKHVEKRIRSRVQDEMSRLIRYVEEEYIGWL